MVLLAMSKDKEHIFESQQYANNDQREIVEGIMIMNLDSIEGQYDFIEISESEFENLLASQ